MCGRTEVLPRKSFDKVDTLHSGICVFGTSYQILQVKNIPLNNTKNSKRGHGNETPITKEHGNLNYKE